MCDEKTAQESLLGNYLHEIARDHKDLDVISLPLLISSLFKIFKKFPSGHNICFQIESTPIQNPKLNILKKVVDIDRLFPVKNVILVDLEGNIKFGEPIENAFCIEDASRLSKTSKTVTLFFNNFSVLIISNGVPLFSSKVQDTSNFRVDFQKKKSVRNCKELLDDFYQHRAKYDNCLDYWDSKPERILRCNPEPLFRKHLYTFLNSYLRDGRATQEHPVPTGEGDVDIYVKSLNTQHENHIIEIKIKGKYRYRNSKKTGTYTDSYVNDGAGQTILYIEAFQSSITIKKAFLVVFNASTNKDVRWNAGSTHKKMEKLVYYLESENIKGKSRKYFKQKTSSPLS